MDTQSKIITFEAALKLARSHPSAVLVTGPFDVLTAKHVRELTRIRAGHPGATLLVAVTEPGDPVLDAAARAGMAAALAAVDNVLNLESQHIASLLGAFPEGHVVRLEAAHQQHMRELLDHVRQRQSL